jgi:hypothetical protein
MAGSKSSSSGSRRGSSQSYRLPVWMRRAGDVGRDAGGEAVPPRVTRRAGVAVVAVAVVAVPWLCRGCAVVAVVVAVAVVAVAVVAVAVVAVAVVVGVSPRVTRRAGSALGAVVDDVAVVDDAVVVAVAAVAVAVVAVDVVAVAVADAVAAVAVAVAAVDAGAGGQIRGIDTKFDTEQREPDLHTEAADFDPPPTTP